jgi:putative transposase
MATPRVSIFVYLRPVRTIHVNLAQSLSKLFVHIKNDGVKDKRNLYAYMGALIKDNESIPVLINGVDDHVHILCVMSKNIAMAKLVEEIKRHSSRWIKTIDNRYRQFAWQPRYGGFSVSPTLHSKTKKIFRIKKNITRK